MDDGTVVGLTQVIARQERIIQSCEMELANQRAEIARLNDRIAQLEQEAKVASPPKKKS